MNKILHGDCLELMKDIDDKSINLVILDPPYNIGKDFWDKIENYIEWMEKVFIECQRVLKDNGSFYLFHNDMEVLSDLMVNLRKTDFIFKQFITWNKRFEGAKNKGFLDGYIETNQLRNYQKMVEYLVFYTFQKNSLKEIDNDLNLYKTIRDYFKKEREKTNLSYKDINKICFNSASNGGGMVSNILNSYKKGWVFPTKKRYNQLQTIDICKKPYDELRLEYEELRKKYNELLYTFNNQKIHHSVWNYEVAKKQGHITPKPIKLIENIIKHSSNEGDLILDPFAGSGTTGISCKNLNRNYILIEKEEKYFELCKSRIDSHKPQLSLF